MNACRAVSPHTQPTTGYQSPHEPCPSLDIQTTNGLQRATNVQQKSSWATTGLQAECKSNVHGQTPLQELQTCHLECVELQLTNELPTHVCLVYEAACDRGDPMPGSCHKRIGCDLTPKAPHCATGPLHLNTAECLCPAMHCWSAVPMRALEQ